MDQRHDAATPMIAQYLEIRAANPDCLLFYRMGDFYELFFADAEAASRALGIALTKRGKHMGEDIPMCGVPVTSADDYLQKLIALGFRVAVCEQTEDPKEAKKRGAKSVVRRDVVRLVTAGTITEERLLEAGRASFLMALARTGAPAERVYGLSWADISTGEFRVAEVAAPALSAEIARIEPREILLSDELHDDPELRPVWHASGAVMAPLPRARFDGAETERRIARFFGVETVDGFGAFSRCELTAAAALLGYVERTQFADRPPLSPPSREAGGASMLIDPATRANLELVRTLSAERRGSLLAAIDRTVTPPGGRLLAQRLASPLTDAGLIARRLDAVEAVLDDAALRTEIRTRLKAAPDMARALSRIAMGRASPRDLGAIRQGLAVAIDLAGRVVASGPLAPVAAGLGRADPALHARLAATLVDDLPPSAAEGGFVRTGYDGALDEARSLRDESRRVIARLQARYAEETGIRALKVRHNAVLGYFVEVGANHADRLLAEPLKQTFFHRQTMAGAMRFSSVELGDLERRLTSAADEALGLERSIFAALSAAIAEAGDGIKAAAEALAVLDVTASLAELATERCYVRPLVEDGLAFEISGGRHPVVEQMLADTAFVANDCDLSPPGADGPGRIRLITGPNMAGKSTYLRQNALLAILAQMGSFVPAGFARIGVVDRLFSRVGAADDLARGRSTFMVEMVETAAILNQAGPRSLVILDEIGRGTATFDGLSIAWGTIEHLHEVNCCRALFATHYHELTALAQRLPRLSNATIRVKEWEGEVVFLHEVVAGAADRSYGVQVAKLAGLPASVIARAREVLSALEAEERKGKPVALIDDLPLFRAAAPKPAEAEPALTALDAIRPDDLSPREALEALYRLKGLRSGKAR